MKISAVSRIWGIISTLAAYSRGALHTERVTEESVWPPSDAGTQREVDGGGEQLAA